jgi:SPP1 family predicted phage head-tail adaptor
MNPGNLDRQVTIQSAATTRDASGGVVLTWSDVVTVWGHKAEQGGREFRSAGTVHAEATVLITIRYYAPLTTDHRLTVEGRTLDILAINEIGRRTHQLCQCRYTQITPAP